MTEYIAHGYNFSYPSSAAAVVFGVYLSARAVFRLDRKAARNRLRHIQVTVMKMQ